MPYLSLTPVRILAAVLLLGGLGARAEEHGHKANESEAAEGGTEVMSQNAQDLMSPTDAYEKLQAGNLRFREGHPLHRDYVAQRKESAHGQYPFACILSCMDSRASSEIIFDQGLGDIFNVRIAGNIINDDVLGSLEYAHKVAGAKLLLVLGHSSCGAVKGAADDVVVGNITGLVAKIRPAVMAIPPDGKPRNSKNHPFIDKVSRMNVIYTVRSIRERSPLLRELQDRGKIDIIGAFYDLETGKVEFYRPLTGATAQRPKKEEAAEPADSHGEGSKTAHESKSEAGHEKAKKPAEEEGGHSKPETKPEEAPEKETHASKEPEKHTEETSAKPSEEPAPTPAEGHGNAPESSHETESATVTEAAKAEQEATQSGHETH